MLDLARIERETESDNVKKENFSIKELLQNARMLCEKTAAERGTVISLDCPSELAANVNSRLLEQAIVNLLDNAIKYGKEGGNIQIRAAAAKNDQVEIHVHDDGPGIDKEHIPRLFERFYRVDKNRSREMGGTGLGLSIVKHIVQTHGGRVWVDSVLEEGSTFTMSIPKKEKGFTTDSDFPPP